MAPVKTSDRKRPVNVTLSESLVEQVRAHTDNLSSTIESLLSDFVAREQQRQRSRQQLADACADSWNALHNTVGSYADEHSTL